jgi:glycosyltransferase involved in cell wall biosynthesis
MTSVVIAAHNEATVIGRCLDTLLQDAAPGEFHVVVVPNGCADDTARVASDRPDVTVVEISEANKSKALNAGDLAATGFPRIYLDADIFLATAQARSLRDALAGPSPDQLPKALAAVPGRVLDIDGRPLMVRAYYAINSRLPAFRDGLFGRGAIALSAEARGRFDTFPDMIADDLFLDSMFSAAEKVQIGGFATTVAAPRRTRDLIRRLVRVRRGNAAMRAAGRAGGVDATVRPADRSAWFTSVVKPNPRLAPAAVIYVGITALAAVMARRSPRSQASWGQDQSTRTSTSHRTNPSHRKASIHG